MKLRTVRAYLRAPGNALGLAVRRGVGWRRGAPTLPNEPKDALFGYLPEPQRRSAEARERSLRARYALGPLRAASRRIDYQENLYLLDALERVAPGLALPAAARVLDVGAKNWSYVAQTGTPARFVAGDVLELELPPQDLVTCFYPFLTPYALLEWGLPLGCFQPAAIVGRIGALLRPGGHALVLTHTRDEAARLQELLPDGLEVVARTPVRSRLVPYWGSTWQREGTLLRRAG